MQLTQHKDKLLCGAVLGLFLWFFTSSLFIAYTKAPQHDDAMFATIPKNFLNGYGWATSYGEKIPFNPDISTGPTLLVPAMAMIAVFGNQTWVPAMTGTLMNILFVILILWQLWHLTRRRAAIFFALLLSISLYAVNDFKTFTAYYTCSLLFIFSLLFSLNQRYSFTVRLIGYGMLGVIGLYGKPLILLSFLIASPCILFFENGLGIKKNGRSFLIIVVSFLLTLAPWQLYKHHVLSQYSARYQAAHETYDRKFFEFHGTGIGQLKDAPDKINYLERNTKKNYRILSRFLNNENNFPIYILLSIIAATFFIFTKNYFSIQKYIADTSQDIKKKSFEFIFPAILALVITGNLCWYVIFSFAMTPGHAFFLTFFSFILLFFLIALHSRSDISGIIICTAAALFFQVRIPPLIEAYRFKVTDIINNEQINKTLFYLQSHKSRYPLASCGYFAAPYRMEYLLPGSQNFVDCYNVLEDNLETDEAGNYFWRDSPNFTFAIERLSFLAASRSQSYVLTPIAEVCLKNILFSEGIFVVCDVSFAEIKDKLNPAETARQLEKYQEWYRTRIKVYSQ